MKIKIDENLIRLAKILEPYSKLYIVGGFVRNAILKKGKTDIDLACSLTIDKLIEILQNFPFKIEEKNIKFGSVKIKIESECYDYTTFRIDTYERGKHFPKKIEFTSDIKKDVKRRDFTINALYYDILSGEIVDLINAKEDIKNKILRVVDDNTLKYDGERILRLIKYSCMFNLKIEEKTFLKAKENCKNVYCLSDNMLKSYKEFFKRLTIFKKLKAKQIIKKLSLENLFEK